MPCPAFHAPLRLTALLLMLGLCAGAAERPNVVLIYADDFGYGDAGCYGAKRVKTPNIDRLAESGLRFTDAHASAATCTPSRYSLMTGEYAWRKKGTNILPGDAALIIQPGRTTLPGMLQKAGYVTGATGKWHLGLGDGPGKTDWNKDINPCPLDIGFNFSFVMAATADRTPCVYLSGRRVVGLDPADPISVSYTDPFPGEPTGAKNPERLKMHSSHGHNQAIVNGIGRIGYMKGGAAARWKDEDMADTFTGQAVGFLEQRAKEKERPFFLYFALHDPHVPRVPHPRFVGKSEMGPRGDALAQADWCVGEVLAALDRLKLADNTIVMFSSDNGPVVDDGYQDQAVEKLGDHRPAGPWHGGKYTPYEGGTRVPLVLRWPGRVKPGTSSALICQVDFLASFAALTGQAFSRQDAPDSENVLPALLGEGQGRATLVEQAGSLSLREGAWKYIVNGPQLYNLANDPAEEHNLKDAEPERVQRMAKQLVEIKRRTTK
ncbi:MAG: arylsulfatase [Verrucomicrobiales bacterium]|nr:arylsulfatase [Verrucomicrobiales bacterium]